jgi:hypothetical protein
MSEGLALQGLGPTQRIERGEHRNCCSLADQITLLDLSTPHSVLGLGLLASPSAVF